MTGFPAQPPAGETPRPWVLPERAVRDLGNGLRIAAVRVAGLPVVQARWVFGSGRIHEPRNRLGAGLLLQRCMRYGSTSLAMRGFAEALDSLGARLGGGVTIDSSMVSISGLNQHLWPIVDLATGVALEPAIPEVAVAAERLKAQQIHRHEWAKPEAAVNLWLAHGLYGLHPYGLPRTTQSGLAATSRADLLALHGSIVDPHRGLLVVVGKLDPHKVVHRLADRFKDLPSQTTPTPLSPPPAECSSQQLVLIPRERADAVCIGFGLPAVARGDTDFLKLSLLNQVLGGNAGSRLFDDLRNRRGLTYGAYSQLDCGRYGGDITATVMVGADDGVECLEALHGQLSRMADEGPDEQEWARAQQLLVGQFPQRASGLAGLAMLETVGWLHELPDGVWETEQGRTATLRLHDARSAASHHFDPRRSTWVATGTPDKLAPIAATASALGLTVVEREMDDLESAGG